jgi:hypothetical protein
MNRIFTAAALLAFAGLTHADGPIDWKVYAFTAKTPTDVMLYLSNDVVRTGDHVRVWMKALSMKKMEEDQTFNKVIGNTAQLLGHSYQPPLGTVTTLTKDQVLMITAYEQIADMNTVVPNAKILYEIDCAQKMVRTLSIVTPTKSYNTVSPWDFVAPESPLADLSKLTCKAS